ncbi:hypothetical protein [Acanthopleuribacter pedis]|uniref:J domain-containing protein n=1 Tax=Acanthopleuribacter pedis TaxID=442870 RepID=A0A8J7Q5B0_9BACT|nr:hypothetical protein [Acanthopleuribacter pedis]MBO1318204.1 hypothetical protein [Acanthopleuribacter pedis]
MEPATETSHDLGKRLLCLVDPFEILGVTPADDNETVRRAFLALVRRFPPERAPRVYQHVRAAYDALRCPAGRRALRLTDRRAPATAPLVADLQARLRLQTAAVAPDDVRQLFCQNGENHEEPTS